MAWWSLLFHKKLMGWAIHIMLRQAGWIILRMKNWGHNNYQGLIQLVMIVAKWSMIRAWMQLRKLGDHRFKKKPWTRISNYLNFWQNPFFSKSTIVKNKWWTRIIKTLWHHCFKEVLLRAINQKIFSKTKTTKDLQFLQIKTSLHQQKILQGRSKNQIMMKNMNRTCWALKELRKT